MITKLTLENFKGRTASYSFGPRVFVHGPNFAGKSAIDQAIRRLVLGYVPGMPATVATLKDLSSGLPMHIRGTVGGRELGVSLEKVKSATKLTLDDTLAAEADERTRILFDPSLFFGLSDNARISKAVELVLGKGFTREQIERVIVVQVGNDPAMLPQLDLWRVVAKRANTVNETLSLAEEHWKAAKKVVSEEKARMQKTVEGIADLSADDATLPSLTEVKITLKATTDRIEQLHGQVEQAKAMAGQAHNYSTRLAQLTSTAMDIPRCQRELESAAIARNAAAEQVDLAYAAQNTAQNKRATLVQEHARRTRQAQRIEELRALSDTLPAIEEQLERAEEIVQQREGEAAQAREDHAAAVQEVENLKNLRPVRPASSEATVRTDSILDFGAVGRPYLISARATLGDDGLTVEEVLSWMPMPTDEEKQAGEDFTALECRYLDSVEDATRRRDELATAAHTAVEAVFDARKKFDSLALRRERAKAAADELANAGPATASPAMDLEAADKELAAAQTELKNRRAAFTAADQALVEAESRLGRAKAIADEIAFMQEHPVVASKSAPEVEAMEKELEIARRSRGEQQTMLDRVTRRAQDQARIDDAAKKRAEVDATLKAIGRVLDLVEQKKQELVAQSIEAPLAVANRLADKILKGPLVFEGGEIGMRQGDNYVSFRAFSGTETAVAVMGLTAGLAAEAPLRVLMLDELGRLDFTNALQLLSNLNGLVTDKVIDQFIVFSPTNINLAAGAVGIAQLVQL